MGIDLYHLGLQLLFDIGTAQLPLRKLRQYHADLGQRKTQRLRPAHKTHSLHVGGTVAAVAVVLPGRCLQQALLLVVAHRVGGYAHGFG